MSAESRLFAASVGMLAASLCCAYAQAAIHDVALAPPWVEPVVPEYDAPAPRNGLRNGTYYLLLDEQVNVLARGDETYSHLAIRAVNAAAVDRNSQFDFSVDPGFQTLTFHFIRVMRDGVPLDQLERARITELPQETQLENRVYNGRYNVNVLLDDVRPGDVIEYAYTIRSLNPAFPTHFAGSYDFGWLDPVRWRRLRFLHPRSHPLQVRAYGATATPLATEGAATRELLFEWKDLASIQSDSELPDWYLSWPYLEATDRASWSQVAREMEPLYRLPQRLDEELGRALDRIRAAGGTAEEQARRALQFVQEQIRYTSISIGRGAHQPTDPADVLRRRFGDCKDKSLLLVTMLRELGIEAQPALVHTERGHVLPDALPTPFAFDHVIVRASIGGKTYWLDGTREKETLPLAALESPAFEHALVIGPGTKGLEPIPRAAPDTRRREIRFEIDARKGVDEPASFAVTTRYFGASADSMRHALARQHIAQRQKEYLEYYAKRYSGLKSAGNLEIVDDEAKNVIEMREAYRLDRAFTPNDDGELKLSVSADELSGYAEALGDTGRTTPIAISYPVTVSQSIRLQLPQEWAIEPDVVTIENPAFRYRSEVAYKDRILDLTYEYQALADHVPPELVPQYLEDRERMYQDLWYTLTHDPKAAASVPSRSVAPLPLTVFLVSLALGTLIALRWVAPYDPPPRVPESERGSRQLYGIRGWLLLPALHMILLPIAMLVILGSCATFAEARMWSTLPTIVSAEMRESAHAALLTALAIVALIFPSYIIASVLFFKKRTAAPAIYIAVVWIGLVVGSSIEWWTFAAGLDEETTQAGLVAGFAPDILWCAVWTLYMIRSKRVSSTFIERRKVEALVTGQTASVPLTAG